MEKYILGQLDHSTCLLRTIPCDIYFLGNSHYFEFLFVSPVLLFQVFAFIKATRTVETKLKVKNMLQGHKSKI